MPTYFISHKEENQTQIPNTDGECDILEQVNEYDLEVMKPKDGWNSKE